MIKVVIIGAGPAGLFAADYLLKQGVKNIMILETGEELKDRNCPEDPTCRCSKCSILEGVGGAGGFSDGKSTFSLTRGTQMEEIFDQKEESILCKIREIIAYYSHFSGIDFEPIGQIPPEIAEAGFEMESYPLNHLGTDGIQKFITNYVSHLREGGVLIKTNCPVLEIRKKKGNIPHGYLVRYEDSHNKFGYPVHETIHAENVIVATGLQGTPWLEAQAHALDIPLSNGPAGFGIRFEARAEVLQPLFDIFYDFKMTYPYYYFDTVRKIVFRSFCCNEFGFVVNENHRTLGIKNVNGHSYLNTDRSAFSNFAIIAKLDALNAQEMVRTIARKINSSANGSTVVQRVIDFLEYRPSEPFDVLLRTNKLASAGVDIGRYMPVHLRNGFVAFLTDLSEILPRFNPAHCFIYAPEIKYYGRKFPIDFNTWEVEDHPGLYVVGNASGYLDSFVSAALTGIISAEHITGNRK